MNPHSLQEQLLHPHECFTQIREQTHVVYNANGKFWEVTDYADVHFVLSEHALFSSEPSKVMEPEIEQVLKSMLNTDPPRHRQLRSLVSQVFTPRAIEQLAPRITSLTHDLLEQVLPHGHMDVIQDLSYPLPIIVIAEMLGIPSEDSAQFKRWSDEIVSSEYDELTGENQDLVARRTSERVRNTMEQINAYFRRVIVERRKHPGSDLISGLLAAQIDGAYLDEPELLGFCALLLIAGNITTTNLIGNAILCFDEHPDAMERLSRQPELIPGAIEEVLRYRSPVTAIARFPLTDIPLHGQTVKKGQFVVAWIASANHDPAQFPEPGRFDIERTPNRHLSFGHGIHFCLGAPLARLETKIVLTILLERMTHIRRVVDQELPPVNSSFIYGARHLPIRFDLC